ncbi:MAG TPA: bifunctional methionine sulfoxide reductase B/A protein [Saprospiraceae bacterium]|nr:bifunctional methionine sulfoxide reductase B/A protein [Saprospiraceae bacterium]HMQ85525.1 bifunctional methionine sulfoxide reductase B/A protein [Saprospiraceae bacterium]
MKLSSFFTLLFVSLLFNACAQNKNMESLGLEDLPEVITDPAKYNVLSDDEKKVILRKGTEWAFSGAFHNYKEQGIYICKQCNLPLFRSSDKFDSGTGWPSFDDMIADNVKELPDADGQRTEIVCANCDGHLGHVFFGEGFTGKQTRHCVNSVSLSFVPEEAATETAPKNTEIQPIDAYVKGKGYEQYSVATFAGGCFWCTEAAFDRINGVIDVISGYSGGEETYPTYEEVGRASTGHAEAIMIYFDSTLVDYKTLLEVFFVAHDPTQLNRQGPDIGPQYRSAIFYHSNEQKKAANKAINKLTGASKFPDPIVTEVKPYQAFWVAEAYHQDYYEAHPENPYVQRISRPKVEKVEKTFPNLLKDKYKH